MHMPRGLVRHLRRLDTVIKHLTTHQGRCTMNGKRVTAGIIIVGDEILKGHTQDTNSHFLCKRLYALGVEVRRVSVIGDQLDEIAKEVSEFSHNYNHVITAGGIGPTHDDMTFEGVAKAFKVSTISHPELVQLLKDYFGPDNLDSAKLKMAQIPSSAKLQYGVDKHTGEKTKYPLVSVNNVYMFPGVPSLLEKAFPLLEDLFRNPGVTFHTEELFVNDSEVVIAADIQRVADQFKNSVVVGSYPDFHNSYYKVKISLESTSDGELSKACAMMKAAMPAGSVVPYEKDPVGRAAQHLYELVDSGTEDSFHGSIRQAVSVLEQALDRYSLDEVCLGFNGGKDCTLLLHLFHAVVQKKYPDRKTKLQALYIRSRLPFPEVELFVQQACNRYGLELIRYEGPIKENLASLHAGHPHVKAVLMGTRQTDPYSAHLESFSMTDPDWPQFMRVNPILTWDYATVWKFLRTLCLPYCTLYDQGYTSLGSMNNTHPNPSLRYIDSKGIVSYRPAYHLVENGNERDGRNT